MSWRKAHLDEPNSSSVHVRLGMTKGAMIAFAVIVLIIIGGFYRLESVASEQRKTIRQVRAQQVENRNALREVCRQGDTIAGLTGPIVRLLEFDIGHNLIPELAVPIYERALRVFQGYTAVLRERPACREVLNP